MSEKSCTKMVAHRFENGGCQARSCQGGCKARNCQVGCQACGFQARFLLYGAQNTAYVPYLTIFLASDGFSLEEVGVLVSVRTGGILVNFVCGFTDLSIMFMQAIAVVRIKQLTRVPQPEYGPQFVFGMVGFGIEKTVSGQVLEVFLAASVSCYTGAFLFCLLLVVIQTVVMQFVYKAPVDIPEETSQVTTTTESNYRRDLWLTLGDFGDALFNSSCVCVSSAPGSSSFSSR